MEIFSIVCLVVILFGIQHLLSWFWRKNGNENSFVLGFFLTVIVGLISFGIIYQIIVWGKNLV